jgi:hypothetical protein
LIQPLLHGFEYALMLPSRDPAFFACGALILDCTGLASVRPVAAHLLSVFLVGIVECELLAGGAAIDAVVCTENLSSGVVVVKSAKDGV